MKRGGKSKGGFPPPKTSIRIPELPDDIVAQLRESIANDDSSFWNEDSAVDELEAALDDFLDLDDPEEEDEPANEVFACLSDSLDRVRVDANGGVREARKALAEFDARLAEAIANQEIHPGNLIMLGKVIWNAGVPVSETLREAVGAAIDGNGPLLPEHAEILSLRAVAKMEDPFDIYEEVSSNMAAFPTRLRIALTAPLVTARKSVIRMGAAGFVLHPDEALARSVIKAFPFSAAPSAAETALVDRLTRIAPWLPDGRREMAEAAFAAMRAGPPAAPAAAGQVVRIIATTHDGSGANSLMACVKRGKRFVNSSVLMKTEGVIEVIEYAELAHMDAERMMALMGATSPTVEIGVDAVAALLELSLGRNVAAGSPPPFRLLQLCETLGLRALRPDSSSAAQVLGKLLAGTSATADATALAHAEIVESDFVESWFEAGERIDVLLRSTKSRKAATHKVLHEYLPSRRPFWAMLCARSALVLKRRVRAADEAWKQFALVGRDIASEMPLERIPLMGQIAERTVAAYFERS